MIYNQAIFDQEAKRKMLDGIKQLARVVKSTLGPNGKNCIIEVDDKTAVITKDGVTCAKNFILKEGPEKIGANLVKEVAQRAAQRAGDGTTASVVLSQAIFQRGLRELEDPSTNVNQLKRGIDQAVQDTVKALKKSSKKITSFKQIKSIATISANNDKHIGQIIAEAISKVGVDGVVTVQPSQTSQTSCTVVEGMQFSNGWLSPYFVNNQETGTVQLQAPLILLYGKKISTLQDILPALQSASKQKSPLLIIADQIQQEVLTTLVVNKMKGVLSVAAVKSPAFGQIRKQIMQDIAALVDGTYVSEDIGVTLQSCGDANLFGVAKRVKITQTDCTIIGSPQVNSESLQKRVSQIKSQIQTCKSQSLLPNLKRRLSKLTNGVAVIHVGASSSVQLREKKDRVDDALCATKCAIQEGIVPGGGSALAKAQAEISPAQSQSKTFKAGYQIVKSILQMPLVTIMDNAGLDSAKILREVKESQSWIGYDAIRQELGDMHKLGVLDPLKVVRTSLESAASVAGLLLTTDSVLVLKEEADLNPQPMMAVPQQQ